MARLPDNIERAARLTSVAPHMRQTFSLLPQPLRLDALVPPSPDALSTSARQLLKLALLEDRVRLGDVRVAATERELSTAPELVLSVGERRIELSADDLALELRTVFARALGALFDGSDATQLLERLAFQSSSLSTLRQLTSHMLAATDVDQALYLMLAGVTSGYGLGFNRAALFLHHAGTSTFTGHKAIGPVDEAEAHRIWEEIELEDLTIEKTIEDHQRGRSDARLEERVRGLTLTVSAHPDDELAASLADGAPLSFERVRPHNPGLASLGVAPEFVLAAVRAHGRVLGLLFADNVYSGEPIRAQRLEHVRMYVDQTALVWENLSLMAHVAELARTDALTSLFNRRELDVRFEREVSRASRGPSPLSFVLIDVDHFKRVNDDQGHAAGDAVLRKLASLLSRSVRGHDVAARFGGDELCLLLPEVTSEQAAVAVGRIGQLAKDAGISVSIGAATWPGDCDAPEGLFEAADARLYRAKREGRARAYVGERAILF
ncbi:MAG: GGDEF domain-containing protein [Myxococcales bacterium]|nr:GGDEF domain-containing protein [Myxococcales bacterium]